MKYLANQESHVNVSISVELLAQLIATGKLCAADLTALDTESQQRLRALMLSVCAQQLKGFARSCQQCVSQSHCQHWQASPFKKNRFQLRWCHCIGTKTLLIVFVDYLVIKNTLA